MGYLTSSRANGSNLPLPRYKYFDGADNLYILIDKAWIKKMGLVIEYPEELPYYVRMDDRIGSIGAWLYDPNDEFRVKDI